LDQFHQNSSPTPSETDLQCKVAPHTVGPVGPATPKFDDPQNAKDVGSGSYTETDWDEDSIKDYGVELPCSSVLYHV